MLEEVRDASLHSFMARSMPLIALRTPQREYTVYREDHQQQ